MTEYIRYRTIFILLLLCTCIPSSLLAKFPDVRLNGIRYWSNDSYTRVVIDVTRPVSFKKNQLVESKRFYIDMEDSSVQGFPDRDIEVKNGILKKIRVGQFDPTTVRIVLELDDIERYKIFTLTDPYRIIIDLYGHSQPQAAAQPPEEPKEPKEPKEKETPRQDPAVQEPRQETVQEARQEALHEVRQEARLEAKQEQKQEQSLKAETEPSKPKPKAKVASKQHYKEEARLPSPAQMKEKPNGKKKIVIDPGHGGHDTGAIGETGVMEKDLVLDISLKMAALLKKEYGYDVILTRTKDVFISLDERTAIANSNNADLFISVHVNANNESSVNGYETYFLNWSNNKEDIAVAARENAITVKKMESLKSELGMILDSLARESKRDESLRLAHLVQKSVVSTVRGSGDYNPVRDIGVKQALFYVLVGASMPAALVELSFITNPQQEQYLKTKAYRHTLAKAVAGGIENYLAKLPDASDYSSIRHPEERKTVRR